MVRPRHVRLLAVLALSLLSVVAHAQVSLTTLDVAYTQSFDTLPATGSATFTNNSTIAGWYHARTGTGTTIVAGDGSNNAGNLYSFGTGTATDRAIGSLGSSNAAVGNLFWGVRLLNNTGATITSLDVSYVGEQWRNSAAAAQTIAFSYVVGAPTVTGSLAEFQTAGTAVAALDFTGPITGGSAAALNGNLAANQSTRTATITGLNIPNGSEVMLRWSDPDHTGADHGLSIDTFSVTPHGAPAGPVISIDDVTQLEGNAGTTSYTFTVSLGAPAAATVTFDIATADGTAVAPTDYAAKSLTAQTITTGNSTYSFTVLGNGDTTPESDETFLVNLTNVTGATVVDGQGTGTIVNDEITLTAIHDVQGNGSATPLPGATVTVEGVVTASYQGATQFRGFFLQEENADVDADPNTSEGIFIFCNTCPTAVAEGQRVRATGTVSEFNGLTEITASTAGSVVITNAGNNLAQVTPATIDLPIVGVVNTYYEARESMRVAFADSLTVSEYFEMARYGTVELYEGGRPFQFTEHNAPSVSGYSAHLDNLDRRRVILDDDNNVENWSLTLPEGQQYVYYPRANGGLSVGTQGVDYFRGGDVVNGLTGVLHWSFNGTSGTDAWRIRSTAATPATFTVTNPRPATAPVTGGTIRAVGMNMLNYFTTIDTTASNNSGPCGPSGTLDCRGADSAAELSRQRERASIVICGLNPDAAGLVEMENNASATVTDLLGAVNARCGGAHPYAFVNTGGALGTDAIRVNLIYRTGVLSPVGSPLVDLNGVHNRPPTAQTFDVVDATNSAFGQRFTLIANHFKSKGCGGSGGDADSGDGQACYNATRNAQSTRLLSWINATVVPAAGDPDVLLVGDFNAYASEDPIVTLEAGGYTDLTAHFLGNAAYSYLFDGQLGHLDFGFASSSLLSQVTGANNWHINADEIPLFEYDDEVKDAGEAAFEEDPDGSALVPPRVLFQPASIGRAADHDPVVVGLFVVPAAADLGVTKTDSPDPVTAGNNLTHTITVTNSGPDAAASAQMSDSLPAGTTFVSLPAVAGWNCTTPAVGANGTVTCTNASMAVGNAVFTLTVNVGSGVPAGVLSNTATVSTTTSDSNAGNNQWISSTTVTTLADVSVTKVDTPDPVNAGSNISYTITASNAGPSNAIDGTLSDTLPAGTTFVSLSSPGGWSCTTPAVGSTGTIDCSIASMGIGSSVFTLVVATSPSTASGTVITNSALLTAATTDPNPGNNGAGASTTVGAATDLVITKSDSPDPVTAGANLTYSFNLTNSGPSDASTVTFSDTLPAGTTFVSFSAPASFSCTTPAVGSTGTVSCTSASFGVVVGGFTLVVAVDPSLAGGTVLTNTAAVTTTTNDTNGANNTATATTTVAASADLSVTKTDSPDPVTAGNNVTYTITVANAGPSNAATVSLSDAVPTNTTFVSLASPAGWSCTAPAVGATGSISCTNASLAAGSSVFTLIVNVNAATASGTVLTNTATVSAASTDADPANNSATATTTVGGGSADLSVTNVDSPDPAATGGNITYAINVTNAGPTTAASAVLSVPLNSSTTFVSLSAAAGWTCTTPAVGATGTVNCTNPAFTVGSAAFTLVVRVNTNVTPGTTLLTTATVASLTADPNPGNEGAVAATAVISPANVSGTKSVTGNFSPGSTVSYTITLTNNGTSTQANNPGDELVDVLPSSLHLITASASSGTAVANTGTNTVTWNGSIAPSASVTITIVATIDAAVTPGTTITNQGTINYDADGNGTNESTRSTDDASQAGGADATGFVVVAAPAAAADIPALDGASLFALAALLAALGVVFIRRS